MAHARVRRLPVTEGQALMGLVSDTDLLTALVPEHEWEHARAVRKERAWHRAEQTGAVSTVRELMSAPVLTIGAAATVQEAVEKMVAAGVASLLASADGDPSGGVIIKRDVATTVLAKGVDPARLTVGEVMSSPVLTIRPEATIEKCSARMNADGVRRFPVQEERDIIGIVSDSDILAAVATHRGGASVAAGGRRRTSSPTSCSRSRRTAMSIPPRVSSPNYPCESAPRGWRASHYGSCPWCRGGA